MLVQRDKKIHNRKCYKNKIVKKTPFDPPCEPIKYSLMTRINPIDAQYVLNQLDSHVKIQQ